jgi:voltage-gated potassium channel
MSRLAIPAFAFLTFYALLVILFASIFSIVSQFSTGDHFRVGSVTRTLRFSEAMHFSIVTISTVGYGDIVPASNIARVLASLRSFAGCCCCCLAYPSFSSTPANIVGIDLIRKMSRSRSPGACDI